ncbi:MAG: tripartite tricarboxylate transporter substrate-binding protein [Burkholderiaceae bacterium]
MFTSRPARWATTLSVGLLAVLASSANAQTQFPIKPMTIVVPNAPGGSTDSAARLLAQQLRDSLGQPVIVENKPGGLGQIAFDYVARSPADGHTLLLSTGSLALLPVVNRTFRYDVLKAVTPVAIFAEAPLVFAITSKLEAKTLPEFIAYAKANPGKLNYGSQGALDTFSNDLFKAMTGVDTVTVRYNGVNPAMQAVLANQVQYTLPTIGFVNAQENSGRIRALAVTTGKRSDLAPTLPTMAEAGVPGFDVNVWFVVVVPSATPKDVVAKLHRAVLDATHSPEAAPRLKALGVTLADYSIEQSRKIMTDDIAKWAKVAADTGYKAE